MVVGLLLQLEGWLVHVPGRRRDYVSRHSRRDQEIREPAQTSRWPRSIASAARCVSGRDSARLGVGIIESGEMVAILGWAVGRAHRAMRFWGVGGSTSTLEISDGRQLAARRMQLSGRAGDTGQGQCCSDAGRQRLCACN